MQEPLLKWSKRFVQCGYETKTQSLLLAGEYRRLNGEYKARAWFQQIVEATPPLRRCSHVGNGLIDFESGKSQSLDTIRTSIEEDVRTP